MNWPFKDRMDKAGRPVERRGHGPALEPRHVHNHKTIRCQRNRAVTHRKSAGARVPRGLGRELTLPGRAYRLQYGYNEMAVHFALTKKHPDLVALGKLKVWRM